ncbi:MAG: hypothetical protein J0I79_10500 [Mesorhizobium sp.]|uniref:hypothetical protein n=1 Tax=Mesorhizobium sp. TaxID=1871066 RepID=UPI001AC36FE3|nr:hypothetical protein [Mesorhizobium sp.]MBN9218373.1 hypothetical protein [Mesorhizobium sp.]
MALGQRPAMSFGTSIRRYLAKFRRIISEDSSKEVPMPALFEDKKRDRTSPKKAGEDDFAFYDSSARKPFALYRQLVNGWLAEFPQTEQADLVKRLRGGSNVQYQATMAEIVVHAALRRLGHTVEIHPFCPHPTRRPDFLVKDANGGPLAFVEVTTFGPDLETVGRDNREAAIYNALETVKLPAGWLMGYSVEKHGKSSPSLGKLRSEVEAWGAQECGDNVQHMPSRIFDATDWKIELTLHGGYDKEKLYERKIAAAMSGVRSVAPHLDLRQALEIKGQRYRISETPYLIVVADCKGSIPVGDHVADALIDALFGSPCVHFRRRPDGGFDTENDRTNDGYWGRHGAPRNRNVSAVVIFPEPNLWKLRDERWQPLIAYNPFEANPLSRGLLPLPGYDLDSEAEYVRKGGTQLADILELPAAWPPDD